MILNLKLGGVRRPEDKTPLLSERRASWSGNVADWGSVADYSVPITNAEVEALKKSSRTKTVNLLRAMRVKGLMQKGLTPVQIFRALRHLGGGYGQSSINHTYAALSNTDRGSAKNDAK